MPAITDPAITNPQAYGSVPIIPPTSTNYSQSTSTSTPNLPNYDALASAASMISQNQMAGQLNPQDLANAQTWAAQRGVATGTGFGSPNNMAAYQQFLGLSAQQLEQQGLTNYEGLLAGAPRTTNTSGSQTIDNNVLAAEYAAAPNPYAAAMANLAAQQAGLAGGAGAGGGGTSQNPNTAAALAAAQRAAAAAGMGTTAGGAGTAPSAWSPGTGPAGGAPPISAGAGGTAGGTAGGSSAYGYQPTSSGSMYMGSQAGYSGSGQGAGSSGGQYGAFGGTIDANGDEWISFGDGSYMNINTGEISYQNPGGGGLALNPGTGIYDYGSGYSGSYEGGTGTTGNLGGLGFGDWYSGGASGGADSGSSASWQQAGYPSEQAYNDAIDAFGSDWGIGGGSDSGGASGGDMSGIFGDWYGVGADAGAGYDTGGDYYDGG